VETTHTDIREAGPFSARTNEELVLSGKYASQSRQEKVGVKGEGCLCREGIEFNPGEKKTGCACRINANKRNGGVDVCRRVSFLLWESYRSFVEML